MSKFPGKKKDLETLRDRASLSKLSREFEKDRGASSTPTECKYSKTKTDCENQALCEWKTGMIWGGSCDNKNLLKTWKDYLKRFCSSPDLYRENIVTILIDFNILPTDFGANSWVNIPTSKLCSVANHAAEGIDVLSNFTLEEKLSILGITRQEYKKLLQQKNNQQRRSLLEKSKLISMNIFKNIKQSKTNQLNDLKALLLDKPALKMLTLLVITNGAFGSDQLKKYINTLDSYKKRNSEEDLISRAASEFGISGSKTLFSRKNNSGGGGMDFENITNITNFTSPQLDKLIDVHSKLCNTGKMFENLTQEDRVDLYRVLNKNFLDDMGDYGKINKWIDGHRKYVCDFMAATIICSDIRAVFDTREVDRIISIFSKNNNIPLSLDSLVSSQEKCKIFRNLLMESMK